MITTSSNHDGPALLQWTELSPGILSSAVVDALVHQGYCVVDFPGESDSCHDVVQLHRTDFIRLKREFQDTYLGSRDDSKIAWLSHKDVETPLSSSGEDDAPWRQYLLDMACILAPFTREAFGFVSAADMGPTMLRMPFANPGERTSMDPGSLCEDDIHSNGISEYLDFAKRRRICLMYFVDGDHGLVELTPKQKGIGLSKAEIPMSRSKLLVFRNDFMKYRYSPGRNDVIVQSWLMEELPMLTVHSAHGKSQALLEHMHTTGPTEPNYAQIQMSLMSMAVRAPACAIGAAFPMIFESLTDCSSDLMTCPRWDHAPYYSPNPEDGLSWARHSGLLDEKDWFSFDPVDYSLSHEFAERMTNVMTRMLLQTGSTAMYDSGFTKRTIRGQHVRLVVVEAGHMAEDRTTTSSILQYIWGMKGPASGVETACSSTLIAVSQCQYALKATRTGPTAGYTNMSDMSDEIQSLVVAVNIIDGPFGFVGNSQAHMIGAKGRSLSYDMTAEGYGRGESCSALYFRDAGDVESMASDRLICVTGSHANEDGRSASMTAPNGPAQTVCYLAAFRDSGIHPWDISFTEFHTTGTQLGDPIEVGGFTKTQEGRAGAPVFGGTGKSLHSHSESASGGLAMIKLASMHMFGAVMPNCHLRVLNPNMDISHYNGDLIMELTNLSFNTSNSGCTGFGFGGSNCRINTYGRASIGPNAVDRKPVPMSELHLFGVPCPRCARQMCHLCLMSVHDCNAEHHRCSAVRDAYEPQDVCSSCFTGRYLFGAPACDVATLARSKAYVVGTWDSWGSPLEFVREPDGTSVCPVQLGDVNREQFRIVLDVSESSVLHPSTACAGPHSPSLGPDGQWQHTSWLIDGRSDGGNECAVYNIKASLDCKDRQVWWEVAPAGAAKAISTLKYEHRYSLIGSAIGGGIQDMRRSRQDKHAWESTFLIGSALEEDFQLLRDRDRMQVLYPAQSGGETVQKVLGPDSMCEGKKWVVRGSVGEHVTVRLRIVDARITVTICCQSGPSHTWQS